MSNSKGQVLFVVFSLLLLVSILIAGTAVLWQSGSSTAALQRDSLRAFYIAQAGIERGRAEVAAAQDDNYTVTFSNVTFGGGHYDLDITWVAADTKELVSTGSFANSTRKIVMRIGRSTPPGGPPYGNAWGYHAKNDDTWKEQ